MKWRPVARVVPKHPDHKKKRPNVWRVEVGPQRKLLCECGTAMYNKPHELEQRPYPCVHLEALYTGGTAYVPGHVVAPVNKLHFRVFLSPLGQQLFGWRWAAWSMESST